MLRFIARIPYARQVHTSTPIISATTLPSSVQVGDVVELGVGRSDTRLGVVTFCTRDKFDVLDTQRQSHIASLQDVLLAIRPQIKLDVDKLNQSQLSALELVPKLDLYSKVVYAKYSQPKRLGAFDFGEALALVQKARNKRGATLEQALAVYIMLSQNSHFARFGVFTALAHSSIEGPSDGGPDPFLSLIDQPPGQKVFGAVHEYPDAGTCSYQSNDIGVMLKEQYDRFMVSVCLPIIPWRLPLDGNCDIGLRGVSVPRVPMVDTRLAGKYGLKKRPTKCLILSALINPWDNRIVETSASLGTVKGQHTGYFTPTFKLKRDMDTIKGIFDSLFPAPLPSEFESGIIKRESQVFEQARHLASVWASKYAQDNKIDMCWLVQQNATPQSGQDFSESEQLSSVPGLHERLGAPSYAPVGFPFDSALSAVNQAQLVAYLNNKSALENVCETFKRQVMPNVVLTKELAERSKRFHVLQQLAQLQLEGPLFLQCLSYTGARRGDLAQARCFELGFDVQVRASMDIEAGDTIVCNSVEALEAMEGKCVLRM